MGLALKGSTAVVTGGSSNIARAVILVLAKVGAKVVIACRDKRRARMMVEDANAAGGTWSLPAETEVVAQ